MSRALLVLHNDAMRAKATDWIAKAPKDTRVEFKGPRRSLPQNDRFHAMLRDISEQATHFGRSYSMDAWKALFLHALGKEASFIPTLDGSGAVPVGQSSSDLSIEEMADLITFMIQWGEANGVRFHDSEEAA